MINDVINNQGKLGKLKFVSKTRNEVQCKRCKNIVKIGSRAFSQSDYTNDAFFPEQIKLCLPCGLEEIGKGTEVKNKEFFDRKMKE